MARSAARRKIVAVSDTAVAIAQAQARLLEAYIEHLASIDESDKARWKEAVSISVVAGLTKEQLAEALGCNQVTILRWAAGLNMPGPLTRRAIKAELLAMLRAKAGSIENHAVDKIRLVKPRQVDAARRPRRLKA